MIKVLLFDGHLIIGAALKELINLQKPCKVVAICNDQDQLFKMLKKHQPDVLVITLMMPWEGGLEFFKQIKDRFENVNILILSTRQDEDYVIRLLKAKVSGFLTPHDEVKKLCQAIETVAKGENFFNKRLTNVMVKRLLDGQSDGEHNKLSDREYDIFVQLAFGHKLVTIAKNLNISDKTVSTYKTRVMRKMNFKSMKDLIKYAIDHKLLR